MGRVALCQKLLKNSNMNFNISNKTAVLRGALLTSLFAVQFGALATELAPANAAKNNQTTAESGDLKILPAQTAAKSGGKRAPMEVVKRPRAEYPRHMLMSRVFGDGLVEVVIDADGKPRELQILQSPHPEFEFAMIKAILEGEYRPATVDGKAVAVRGQMPFRFKLDEPINAFTVRGNSAFSFTDSKTGGRVSSPDFDEPPEIKVVTPLVYPRELLQKSIEGKAEVRFIIGKNGLVQATEVVSASHPEFGAAAKAGIAGWEFTPAKKDGKPVAIGTRIEQTFGRDSRDSGVYDRADQLLKLLGANGGEIAKVNELDARPRILYQTTPAITGTEQTGNVADANVVIEFFIDPDGAVQLPRIVSANSPDLGWAAASAIKRWIFEVPMKNGKPVFARHQVRLDMR
jgi:TonB family protein